MSIDFDRFVSWAEKRFDDIRVSGNEVKLNSIFCEDTKHKLWCNPSGGKKERHQGVYHCWKTDNTGTLVSLVMQVDKCSYSDALEILGTEDITLYELELKLEEFLNKPKVAAAEIEAVGLELPPFTFNFWELSENNYYRLAAETYLLSRKLPLDNLMVCTNGDYKNRIVIPYYDREGTLIYYNTRDLNPDGFLRYLGPPKTVGVGKGDVLYFPKWPNKNEKAYLSEGEFDSLAICTTGLIGGAFGGKNLSEKQLLLLGDTDGIVLCLDNDKAGRAAVPKIYDSLISVGKVNTKVFFVFPPKQYKDWNELSQKIGSKVLKEYILSQTRKLTFEVALQWKMDAI
jgi:hypothetical protein